MWMEHAVICEKDTTEKVRFYFEVLLPAPVIKD